MLRSFSRGLNISSVKMLVGRIAISIRISDLEKKFLMINTRLVFNDGGIKVYVMAKLIRVLRNFRVICLQHEPVVFVFVKFPHEERIVKWREIRLFAG